MLTSVFLLTLTLESASSFFSQCWADPEKAVDPKLMDIVSYPQSEINGIISISLKVLPEGKSNSDYWHQQCWDDPAFLKGSS